MYIILDDLGTLHNTKELTIDEVKEQLIEDLKADIMDANYDRLKQLYKILNFTLSKRSELE